MIEQNLIGYSTKTAMRIRYPKKGQPDNYAYRGILNSIQQIKYLFLNMEKEERENYIAAIEKRINLILLKPEKEWLKDSLDFEVSAINLNYSVC